jgi:lysozyme
VINAVIDLSHHNTIASYKKIAADGVLGVVQKATQGFTFKDPTFKKNKAGVTGEGMLFGAYHFGVGGDPVAQADFFLSTVGDTQLLVLDFEGNSHGSSMTLLEAESFVHRVFTRTGRYPGLYSGHTVKEALALVRPLWRGAAHSQGVGSLDDVAVHRWRRRGRAAPGRRRRPVRSRSVQRHGG